MLRNLKIVPHLAHQIDIFASSVYIATTVRGYLSRRGDCIIKLKIEKNRDYGGSRRTIFEKRKLGKVFLNNQRRGTYVTLLSSSDFALSPQIGQGEY